MKIKVNETFIFKEKTSWSFFNKKISEINIDLDKEVLELKKIILKKYKLDDFPNFFKIIYKNKEIPDNKTLKEAQVKENSVLYIVCKDKRAVEELLRKKGLL